MSQLRTISLSIGSHRLVQSTTALILVLAGGFNLVACSRSAVADKSGEPISWTLTDRQVFDVSAKASGEAISLTFRAADSERTTVYRSDGQQLVTETIITSPLLSTPIRYRVVYNRAS